MIKLSTGILMAVCAATLTALVEGRRSATVCDCPVIREVESRINPISIESDLKVLEGRSGDSQL